jgi:hypothetical protein
MGGCGWVSCLRSGDVRKLIESRDPSDAPLFTQNNLAEIVHPDFPGERLIACYNPLLSADRARTREELLVATESLLTKLQEQIKRRVKNPMTAADIGIRAGRLINKYKVAKHFTLEITDGQLGWARKTENIAREQALDGIYIVRTSESTETLSAPDAVRVYKSLGNVEKAFRTFKGVDLRIRPIHHRLEDRVRAHVFLCMLAYYIEWHMRQALASLLYAEEDLAALRMARDPVDKAQPSPNCKRKQTTRESIDGLPVRRWDGLLNALSTQIRNVCRVGEGKNQVSIIRETEPTAFQSRVFSLLDADAPCWLQICAQ